MLKSGVSKPFVGSRKTDSEAFICLLLHLTLCCFAGLQDPLSFVRPAQPFQRLPQLQLYLFLFL